MIRLSLIRTAGHGVARSFCVVGVVCWLPYRHSALVDLLATKKRINGDINRKFGIESGVSANNEMPRSVLLLGWGGVLPFAGLAIAVPFGLPSPIPQAETMLIGYGAVILSFVGGVHWGLAMQSEAGSGNGGAAWQYVLSVIPALVGWTALALETFHALFELAAAFLALLIIDMAWVSGRKAPAWYGSLRLQLTSAVLLCLGLAWIAA